MEASAGERTSVPDAAIGGAAYAALFVLGLATGLLTCFHFSASVAGFPVGVLVAIAFTFAVCWLGGLGMRTKMGAAAPAAGWILVAMILAVQRPEGDLVITNTAAGLGLLFGGTAAAGAAVGLAPSAWLRRTPR